MNDVIVSSSDSEFDGFSELSETEYNNIMNMPIVTQTSNMEDNDFESDDDLPLSTLKMKMMDEDLIDDTMPSESEYSDSSGSEYKFTSYEN